MYCIKVEIPQSLCEIDDELKAEMEAIQQ